MRYALFVALSALTATVQVKLIYLGVLHPTSAYDAGNMAFDLAGLFLIAWMGWTSAQGIKNTAVKGGLMALAGFAVFSLGSLAGVYLRRPVLGIPVASFGQLIAMLAFACVLNAALGAAVASAVAFIANAVKRKPLQNAG
jgi:hypothetical protein